MTPGQILAASTFLNIFSLTKNIVSKKNCATDIFWVTNIVQLLFGMQHHEEI